MELSELERWKKITFKMFFNFRKLKFQTPSLKNYFFSSLFLQMFPFHHWFLLFFLGVFIVDCICSIDHCFFRCFYLTTYFTIVFECFHFNDFLFRDCFLSDTSLLSCRTRVRRIWGVFFTLRHFLPYTPSRHLAQPVYIEAFLGPAVQSWRLQDLPLRFETQIRPIYLFESHSVQQKILVGRYYLCIKDLWNTVTKSSRFWTRYLIAICIIKPMSCILHHRSS